MEEENQLPQVVSDLHVHAKVLHSHTQTQQTNIFFKKILIQNIDLGDYNVSTVQNVPL